MPAATPILTPTALETARAHHAQNHLREAAESYRDTLAANPTSREALLGLSLIARQSNQLGAALHMAQAALSAGPLTGLAWANYGDCLFALSQAAPNQDPAATHQLVQQAQSAFQQALALDPSIAAAHYGLGNTLALEDNFPVALASFQSALNLAASIPEFHFACAFAQSKLGRHTEAVAAYRQAVTLRPSFAPAWLNLGVELIADGRGPLADLCYRQALASSQGNPHTQISAHLNLGHLQRTRRQFPEARQSYQRAHALAPPNHPRHTEVQIAFAYLHMEQHDFPLAWQSLHAAQSADPDHQNPEIPNARGILLLAQDSAPLELRLLLSPNSNESVILSDQRESKDLQLHFPTNQENAVGCPILAALFAGRVGITDVLESAIQTFHQAESLNHKTAASNRGNALLRLGRVEEALAAHQTALTLDPHHPGVRYNLALTQLRAGNFLEGWPNYEIRWQFREVHSTPRRFPQTRWQGEPLPPNARLFLYAEQGLGDTIQFIRYLTLVVERIMGAPCLEFETWDSDAPKIDPFPRLILEIQPTLLRLLTPYLVNLQTTHPNLTTQLLSHGDPLPPFTHHCPLMSLPAVFQTTLETIPTPIPYLHSENYKDEGAPPLKRSLLQGGESQIPRPQPASPESLVPSPRLSIGLNWSGNPNYRADRERSTHLATFFPLLQLPNIQWISLQKGPSASQIAEIQPNLPKNCALLDLSSNDRDLADTAALIASLDLVITTDTAIAHLAGALGKPLWLLLPWQSDWRWMQHRPDTPWYPTARLFRQSSPNNWPELIHRVSSELQAAATTNDPHSPFASK